MKKRLPVLLLAAVLLVAAGAFVSYAQLGVANPFASAQGLVQVLWTDRDYVQVQEMPKVVLAKPQASLTVYMEERGYAPEAEKQMGSLWLFTDGQKQEAVRYSQNRYFSRWAWEE